MRLPFIFLITLFLWPPSAHAQEVRRLATETPEDFAKRIGPPNSELTHKVIQTEAWGRPNTVIAFYVVPLAAKNDSPATQVEGYLFIPGAGDSYEKILIKNFEEEGDTPRIEAVFFANADKDKAKELIVICSWHQSHYDVNGKLYATFVFDDLRPGSYPAELTFLESVSKQVSGDCECEWRDGRKQKSKYKTAASVKAGLRRLGF